MLPPPYSHSKVLKKFKIGTYVLHKPTKTLGVIKDIGNFGMGVLFFIELFNHTTENIGSTSLEDYYEVLPNQELAAILYGNQS